MATDAFYYLLQRDHTLSKKNSLIHNYITIYEEKNKYGTG